MGKSKDTHERCAQCDKILIEKLKNRTWIRTDSGVALCIECHNDWIDFIKQHESEGMNVHQ